MDINKEKYSFEDFKEIIEILRSPEGCPWDRAQTHESIRKNLIEESYEFIHEVDVNSKDGMCEELGDVLLQVLLHSQIAKDNNEFTIEDVIDRIAKKMIFRHPHVFEKDNVENADEAYDVFKSRKDKEKKYKNKSDEISHIPEDFPALIKSYKLLSKLNKIQPTIWSKDFNRYNDKLEEELQELKEAYKSGDKDKMEDELGDVLMTAVSLGNAMDIDAEVALNRAFKKVLGRIKNIEEKCLKSDEKIDKISPETFSNYWESVKNIEK